jgi:hypothetical protein
MAETCCRHFRSGQALLAITVIGLQSKATFQLFRQLGLKAAPVTSCRTERRSKWIEFLNSAFVSSLKRAGASVRLDTASTLGK